MDALQVIDKKIEQTKEQIDKLNSRIQSLKIVKSELEKEAEKEKA
jgi:prefoldin subunit 5